MLKFENKEIIIVGNNVVRNNEIEQVEQDIKAIISLFKGTYRINPELGNPWFEFLSEYGITQEERFEILTIALFEAISNYDGVIFETIKITRGSIKNRVGSFEISLKHKKGDIKLTEDIKDFLGKGV